MTLTKIKIDQKKMCVQLAWTNEQGEQMTLKSYEPPKPDFIDALQALTAGVVSMCMMEDTEHLITVRGVAIKMDDNGDRAIVITALRELDWIETPWVVNTPYASETLIPMHPGDDLSALLDTLEAEAAAYVNGERAQSDLFKEDSGPTVEMRGTFDFTEAAAN